MGVLGSDGGLINLHGFACAGAQGWDVVDRSAGRSISRSGNRSVPVDVRLSRRVTGAALPSVLAALSASGSAGSSLSGVGAQVSMRSQGGSSSSTPAWTSAGWGSGFSILEVSAAPFVLPLASARPVGLRGAGPEGPSDSPSGAPGPWSARGAQKTPLLPSTGWWPAPGAERTVGEDTVISGLEEQGVLHAFERVLELCPGRP